MATRSNVASLIGLRAVTPRSIAYVAVQVKSFGSLRCQAFLTYHMFWLQCSLSNATAWRINDIDFNYAKFYSTIVNYFEVTPGPHAQSRADELLA